MGGGAGDIAPLGPRAGRRAQEHPSLTCSLRNSAGLQSCWLRLALPSLSLRFKESVQTLGYVDSLNRVHCISPLLYESGHIPFTISLDNGRSFPHAGTWLAGEPSLCQAGLGCKPVDATLPGPWFPSTTHGHGTFPNANPCTLILDPVCLPVPLAEPVPWARVSVTHHATPGI